MLTLDDIFGRLEAMGYNQSAIARRLNTSEANVSRWRKGVHSPTPDVIEALAELAMLNPATVAVVVMASRASGKSRKAWEKAYGDLARAGLAAVVLAVGLGAQAPAEAQPTPEVAPVRHYANLRRRRRQEAATAASRWLSRLSGRVNNNQPALQTYAIWRIQTIVGVTLRAACCRLGSWLSNLASSRPPSGPMLGWTPA
jgi:transcriptional regulator with XRE-family HTH domain